MFGNSDIDVQCAEASGIDFIKMSEFKPIQS